MIRDEFEKEFNSRTIAYHPDYRSDDRSVVVVVGDAADSEPGHVIAIALVNLLARAHRRIAVVGDLQRPLRCFDHFRLRTLHGATVGLARAINPFIDITATERGPDNNRLLTIGIAADGDLRLGCDGWTAINGGGAEVNPSRTSILGAALAVAKGQARRPISQYGMR